VTRRVETTELMRVAILLASKMAKRLADVCKKYESSKSNQSYREILRKRED
jgi:hypothetical protein